MCIEEDKFLPVNANALFQPMALREGVEPLNGCVLSIRYDCEIIWRTFLEKSGVRVSIFTNVDCC